MAQAMLSNEDMAAIDRITSELQFVTSEEPPRSKRIRRPPTKAGDPKDYVLNMFEIYISPNISSVNPTLTAIRRGIYKRAVGEHADAELNGRTNLTAEEIFTLTQVAFQKAGIVIA